MPRAVTIAIVRSSRRRGTSRTASEPASPSRSSANWLIAARASERLGGRSATVTRHVMASPNGKVVYFGRYNTNTVGVVTVRNVDRVRVLDVSADAPHLVGETFIGVQPDTMHITNDGNTLVVGLRSVPSQMALMDTETLDVRFVTFPDYRSAAMNGFGERQVHVHRAREQGHDGAGRDRPRRQRFGPDPRHLDVSRRTVAARRLLGATGAAVGASEGAARRPPAASLPSDQDASTKHVRQDLASPAARTCAKRRAKRTASQIGVKTP